MNLYQRVIHHRTYARKTGDRFETFEESVSRYIKFLKDKFDKNIDLLRELDDIHVYMNQLKIVGSMRLFFAAGDAVDAENAMAFNCKYQAIHELKSFPDLLYSLLCTCGVGISVRQRHIERLPKLPKNIIKSDECIVVEDSRTGWAVAFYNYLTNLFYNGISKQFDTHKVRNKGEPLLTSGGYASGPEPLHELRAFVENICINASGRKLKSIECFDIACMIANCAVQGGVRRAAIITLFDDTDDEMFYAKSKENLLNNTHRYNSNNTMVWYGDESKLDKLIEANMVNGEPGILFYKNLIDKVTSLGRVDDGLDFGVNPCSEVILLSDSFCNLTEVILRPEDTLHDDMLKVRYATILALLQATLTDYGFISTRAKYNQENDPIIGVSLTGLCDCPKYSSDKDYIQRIQMLKQIVNNTVDEFWKKVGLKLKPKASTCIKPSGTVSKLVNSSSGIHPRYSKYYINRIIIGKDSGLYESLAEQGVPYLEFDSMEGRVFEFPIISPEKSILVNDMTAVEQLRYTNNVNDAWCDHNTSVTIYVDDHEWEDVKRIIKSNHTFISLSFLPKSVTTDTSGFLYLPLEAIDKEEYERRAAIEKSIDINKVFNIKETKDNQTREFACTGGSCSF